MADNNMNNNETAFINDKHLYDKKPEAVPTPQPNIGIDTDKSLFDNIIEMVDMSSLDMSSLQSFTSVSQSRNQIYSILDMMSEDSIIAAILKTYAADATEYNDAGQIIWAESSDSDVAKYVNFLLDTMNCDKHAYEWIHSLALYGDAYFRLYRNSDYNDEDLYKMMNKNKKSLNESLEEVYKKEENKVLEEDVKIKAYKDDDHYAHYIELQPNPAEIFELTRHGKTYAYIKADVNAQNAYKDNDQAIPQTYFRYKLKSNDVTLYDATEYVHACLEDTSTRTPEEVTIFNDTNTSEVKDESKYTYKVKRGQSIFYDSFKIWRELALLENSIILNRVTKSAIVRAVGVEVGDMPKHQVKAHLNAIKQMVEQKSALNTGDSLTEYTNPGPIENTIYVPIRNNVGSLNIQTIGGDVDIKSLADLEYFQDKFYGSLGVPKAYFGVTGDGAGFNGGQSLSIISSRYAKNVKMLQNALIQALTDAVNLMLLDKDLDSYVNKFTIKMHPPVTQEELDRRENLSGKVQLVSDVMGLVNDIQDEASKLEILKSLLSNVLTNPEVIDIIQKEIDKLESEEEVPEKTKEESLPGDDLGSIDVESNSSEESSSSLAGDLGLDTGTEETSTETEEPASEEESGEEALPNPSELGIGDLTNNNNPEI